MITDADKLARYDDLANLVEELHDENMRLRKERDGLLAELEGALVVFSRIRSDMRKNQRYDYVQARDGALVDVRLVVSNIEAAIASVKGRVCCPT